MKFYLALVYHLIQGLIPLIEEVLQAASNKKIYNPYDNQFLDWYVTIKPWLKERLDNLRREYVGNAVLDKTIKVLQVTEVLKDTQNMVKPTTHYPEGGEVGVRLHNLALYNNIERLQKMFESITVRPQEANYWDYIAVLRQFRNILDVLDLVSTNKIHIHDRESNIILCVAQVPGIRQDDSIPSVPMAEEMDNYLLGRVAEYNRPENWDKYCPKCGGETAPH